MYVFLVSLGLFVCLCVIKLTWQEDQKHFLTLVGLIFSICVVVFGSIQCIAETVLHYFAKYYPHHLYGNVAHVIQQFFHAVFIIRNDVELIHRELQGFC